MSDLNIKYMEQIRENKPIEYNGLLFYPLTVRQYSLFSIAKPSFELMQASLKQPKIARLAWCACLYALDEQCKEETGKSAGFLSTVLFVLANALRLEAFSDASDGGNMKYPVFPVFSNGELVSIAVGNQELHTTFFSMQQMSEVRKIIAVQNGYNIPNENWNPELIRASQYNEQMQKIDMDMDFESLIYSVAVNTGNRVDTIYDWSIREFNKTIDAIDRKINYMIFNIVEHSGFCKFTKGNPFPSWKFNRKVDMPCGFRTIADIDAGTKGLLQGT